MKPVVSVMFDSYDAKVSHNKSKDPIHAYHMYRGYWASTHIFRPISTQRVISITPAAFTFPVFPWYPL